MTFMEAGDFKDNDGNVDHFECCKKSITCFFMVFFTSIMTFGFLIAEIFHESEESNNKKYTRVQMEFYKALCTQ